MSLADARWIDLTHSDDERGTLTALEGEAIPFPIRRLFYMHRVPWKRERGYHAHRYSRQCLIPVAGALAIDAWDATTTAQPRPVPTGHDLGAPVRLPAGNGGAGAV